MIENPAVRAALEDLAQRCGGRPTPEAVVEEARSPNHPLHSYFEWDDSEAAIKYRVHQARQLLNKVRIEFAVQDVKIKVPMFFRDPQVKPSEQGYVSIAVLKTEKETAREVVIAEFIRAASCLERAKAVAKVLGLVDEIASLLEHLGILRARLTE